MKNFYKKTEAVIVKRKRYTKQEEIDYLNRIIKRANAAAGYETEKKPTKWIWNRDGEKSFYFVEGDSRSEVKGKIKKELGISKNKRLPKDIILVKASEIDK